MPPLDASIPLQVRNPQFMGPQDVMSLQNLSTQGQMNQLQLMEAQRDSQTKNALRLLAADPSNIDQATGIWSDAGVQKASRIDPFLGMQIAQQRATSLKTLAETARMQRAQPILDQIFGGAQGRGIGQAPRGEMGAAMGGVPNMGQIQAALISGDPGLMAWGKAMLEAQKGVAQRPGAPVVNPITGQVIAQPTPSVPQGVQLMLGPQGQPSAGVVPGYGQAMTTLSGIPNLSQGLITVKTSSGQDIQLTQPEYVAWQQTGQLPTRYGAPQARAPLPRNVPEEDRAAYEAVASGAVPAAYGRAQPGAKPQAFGTIGATQSEAEKITQERQRAGGKALDEQFAKDYSIFVQGGASDAAKQLSQLQEVIGELKKPGSSLTGPVIGSTPDVVRKFTNPESIAMRERVEEVVQRALRAILGAQFTEREGERLIARAYNPNLSESENAIRVQRLFDQLNSAFTNKKSAAEYFAKNGTLEGWTGTIPAIPDFDPEAASTKAKAISSGKRIKWSDLGR